MAADTLCIEISRGIFLLTSEEGGWSTEEWQERGEGGSLALVDSKGKVIHSVTLGHPTNAWITETSVLAIEKATRTIETHLQDEHIISSWQTRNHYAGEYGGGIVVEIGGEPHGLAFSGLPEPVDHFMMVRLALIRRHGVMLVHPPGEYLKLARTATQAQMRACGFHVDINNPAVKMPSEHSVTA